MLCFHVFEDKHNISSTYDDRNNENTINIWIDVFSCAYIYIIIRMHNIYIYINICTYIYTHLYIMPGLLLLTIPGYYWYKSN